MLGAGLGLVVFWLMHRALGDDALISVSFARTLAKSGTWGGYPGLRSNTQTSPLNAWLLAAGIALAGHPIMVVGAALRGCLAACGWLATDVAQCLDVHPAGGWLAVGLLGTSPVLVSTVGLETYLGIAVLLGVAALALRGQVALSGLLCGLAVLTRPDLAVPAAVIALFVRPDQTIGTPRRMAQLGAVAGIAALVAVPWHLWSWFALGGAAPATTWVRTAWSHARRPHWRSPQRLPGRRWPGPAWLWSAGSPRSGFSVRDPYRGPGRRWWRTSPARRSTAWSATHRRPVPPIPVRGQLTFASANPSPPGREVRRWPVDTPIRGRDAIILTERNSAR